MPEIAIKSESPIETKIRKVFDVTTQKWHYSVVDVIENLLTTQNAQNYWKVLKNRLKKRAPELVTKCNQLKMRADDGKFYLTDVADSATMIEIIEAIPKASVEALKELIGIVEEAVTNDTTPLNPPLSGGLPHPDPLLSGEGEPLAVGEVKNAESSLLVDAFDAGNRYIIRAFIAGASPEDIHIYVYDTRVVISGKRGALPDKGEAGEILHIKSYLRDELLWTTFAREITLPSPVHTDFIKRSDYRGMLTVELQKI